jgi:cytochrome P450
MMLRMDKTDSPPTAAAAGSTPIPAEQCPHLGREYNHFAGPQAQNPYPFYERLRKEAPITFNPMLGMWLVSRYDDIVSVLDNPASFSSAYSETLTERLTPEAREILGPGPIIHDSPLTMDPPVHTRVKRLLQRGFTPAKIARLEPLIRQIANELIDGFIRDGRADLVKQFAYPLPMQGILRMVGVSLEDMEKVKRWSTMLMRIILSTIPPEEQPAVARGLVEYRAYCSQLIEERRRQPQEDLTSDLIRGDPTGEALTMPELMSLIGGSLLVAGHETSTAQLSLSLKLLLEQPERWQRLLADRTLIPKAVEECMRLEGAAPGLPRVAIQDVVVGGVLLPKGSRLLLLYSSANHDEAQFKDPERYEPQRENLQHLNFGRGIHFCVGAQLARLQLRVALEQLVERLPGMRLVPGQDYGYSQDMLIVRAMRQLQVEWPVP